MKKTLFLVHDPGGYDVIFPVVQLFRKAELPFEFFCLGPAALLNPEFASSETYMIQKMTAVIDNQETNGLVTGTSWGASIELRVIQIFKQSHLPTFSCIDYWSNYALRFKMNDEFIFPDYCIVMDQIAKVEAIMEGIPEEIIHVLGHPGLDQFVELRDTVNSFKNTGDPIKILFLSQPVFKLHGNQLGFTEDQVIEDCIQLTQVRPQLTLKIKFHPKESKETMDRYAHLAVTGDLKSIVMQYDIVIGMATMGLLHALLLGVHVVSYQPGLIKFDTCITNKLGVTNGLTAYEDLLLHLDHVISNLEQTYENLDPQKFIWWDGQSSARVCAFLREELKI